MELEINSRLKTCFFKSISFCKDHKNEFKSNHCQKSLWNLHLLVIFRYCFLFLFHFLNKCYQVNSFNRKNYNWFISVNPLLYNWKYIFIFQITQLHQIWFNAGQCQAQSLVEVSNLIANQLILDFTLWIAPESMKVNLERLSIINTNIHLTQICLDLFRIASTHQNQLTNL